MLWDCTKLKTIQVHWNKCWDEIFLSELDMVWGSTKPESIAANASLSECNTVNKFQAFDIGSAYSHPLGVLIAKCLHLQESLDNSSCTYNECINMQHLQYPHRYRMIGPMSDVVFMFTLCHSLMLSGSNLVKGFNLIIWIHSSLSSPSTKSTITWYSQSAIPSPPCSASYFFPFSSPSLSYTSCSQPFWLKH